MKASNRSAVKVCSTARVWCLSRPCNVCRARALRVPSAEGHTGLWGPASGQFGDLRSSMSDDRHGAAGPRRHGLVPGLVRGAFRRVGGQGTGMAGAATRSRARGQLPWY